MTQLLAVGSALFCATLPVMTGLSAAGEPQHMPRRGVARLAVITVSLVALSGFGAISVGVSRLLADVSDAVIALILSVSRFHLERFRLAADLARPLAVSTAMAGVVLAVGPPLTHLLGHLGALCASVALGAAIYLLLLALLDQTSFAALKGDLLGRSRAAG